MAVLLGRSPSS